MAPVRRHQPPLAGGPQQDGGQDRQGPVAGAGVSLDRLHTRQRGRRSSSLLQQYNSAVDTTAWPGGGGGAEKCGEKVLVSWSPFPTCAAGAGALRSGWGQLTTLADRCLYFSCNKPEWKVKVTMFGYQCAKKVKGIFIAIFLKKETNDPILWLEHGHFLWPVAVQFACECV